jgi:hypothetical protein
MMPNSIGTLRETNLHAALKAWYAQPGDEMEVNVEGFWIDLKRGPLLIEIQTRNFAAIKRKLHTLIEHHPVRLVHPIAQEKWVVRQTKTGEALGRRKSPKHGRAEDLFVELVSFPELAAHRNFTLEVVLTREEEIKVPDKRASWRRKGWRVVDRGLIEVMERIVLAAPKDYAVFLPVVLPQAFTCRDLSEANNQPLVLAQKMAYCLRRMGVLEVTGKQRGAWVYQSV